MKVYRSPIDGEELKKLAKDHEYGDTWVTIVVPIDFSKYVDPYCVNNFEEDVSSTISPNDEELRNIEFKVVGFEEDNRVLVEITGDASYIINSYDEMEEKQKWFR